MRRVVITGLGMSTSLGSGVAACWQGLIEGRQGIRRISFWDPSEYTTKVAAEVHHIPAETGISSMPRAYCRRTVRLFNSVAREAFLDSGIGDDAIASDKTGIAVGTSVNYLDMRLMEYYFRLRRADQLTLDMEKLALETKESDASLYRNFGDTAAILAGRALNLSGPVLVTDTACAASAHAIGEAFRMIRRGQVTAMIAGGAAALVSPVAILAFALLGALSKSDNPAEASRPFDKLRDGFVMGEGAGVVVLEELENARRRGARIYAELTGFGSNLNAHSLTDPSPDGASEARAMQLALADGGVAPEEVDYVAAHGTSTPKNDATETEALKRAFGKHANRLMISSNKGQIGHTISAAGVCNLISAVKAIVDGIVPPTINLRHADLDCDLDYVPNRSRPARIRTALCNAFAFGGQNAVLAVRAMDS